MFTFKFKALLDYRKTVEERRHQEFLESRRTWEHEQEALRIYHKRWEACMAGWREAQKKASYHVGADMYERYMLRLRAEIEKQVLRVKDALSHMENKRAELLKARKNKKSMELLETKLLNEYLQEEADKERKFLDEIATQQFNTKSSLT